MYERDYDFYRSGISVICSYPFSDDTLFSFRANRYAICLQVFCQSVVMRTQSTQGSWLKIPRITDLKSQPKKKRGGNANARET